MRKPRPLKVVVAGHLTHKADVFARPDGAAELHVCIEQPEPGLPVVATEIHNSLPTASANLAEAEKRATQYFTEHALAMINGQGLMPSKHHGHPCLRVTTVFNIAAIDAVDDDQPQPTKDQYELVMP